MSRVGVLCVSIGVYNRLWKGFYDTVNRNFCIESAKHFYLFTDNPELAKEATPENVTVEMVEDKGWALNVIRRSEFFLAIEDKLRDNDFLFNLNVNYRAVAPIHDDEVLPDAENGWISALCFDFYCGKNPDSFTYERNPFSKAYIPNGCGQLYYQGGFYGGRVDEFLSMSRELKAMADADISQRIVPRFHDESYLNRYLACREPKAIGTSYAVAEQWNPGEDAKGILLDKEKQGLKADIENMKAPYSESAMSFLVGDDLVMHPIGVVNLQGGLGNQLFQYALFLQLQRSYPNRKFYLNTDTLNLLESHSGYQLEEVFSVSEECVASREMIEKMKGIPEKYLRHILCPLFAESIAIENSSHPVWIITGYWQSDRYFGDFVREKIRFDYSKLNEKSKKVLEDIRHQDKSVGIHVRRGDYVTNMKTYNLMGEICTKDYYRAAVGLFDANCKLYVFSDDIAWCRNNLTFLDATFISDNRGKDSWQDMALLAACEHQIIANSSFSWWAAWLNPNPEKKVVAPARWYNPVEVSDIVPPAWIRVKPDQPKKMYNDLSIIIPIRIDSTDRKRNLDLLIAQLTGFAGLTIILLEADIISRIESYEGVQQVYINDRNPMFHRTKYINILTKLCETEYVGVWDADVVIPDNQIDMALEMLRRGEADMVYPYDGRFYNVFGEPLKEYLESNRLEVLLTNHEKHVLTHGRHSCGGAFMVNLNAYVEAGGENEKFKAWGAEDFERYKRWEILGYRIARTEGALYHLSHPIGENSTYTSSEAKRNSMLTLLATCRMKR